MSRSQGKDKQPEYGVIPAEDARLLSGLELIQRIASGTLPSPFIGRTLHFKLTEVEKGRVVFSGEPSIDFYNPLGTVHGGYAATLLDSCMGCAIHTMLPAATGYTTLEIKVNYVRTLTENTGPVRAEGRVLNIGKRVATAEGRLFDSENRLCAHGTTTCLIFPL
jgi:uncharacterized protein (TIGR00369 family)